MAYRLLSGDVIEPSSTILSMYFTEGLAKDLAGHNFSRLGHPLESQGRSSALDFDGGPVIVLSLCQLPRLGEHFVLGSNSATSDVTIGTPGRRVSAQHLRFGFDQHDRVVMRDSSTLGTRVSYNDQKPQHRRGTLARPFTWVLPPGYEITVKILPFEFVIRVADHSAHADEFCANLARFRAACRAQMPQLSSIDLAQDLPATAGNLSPTSPASGVSGAVTDALTPLPDTNAGMANGDFAQQPVASAHGSLPSRILRLTALPPELVFMIIRFAIPNESNVLVMYADCTMTPSCCRDVRSMMLSCKFLCTATTHVFYSEKTLLFPDSDDSLGLGLFLQNLRDDSFGCLRQVTWSWVHCIKGLEIGLDLLLGCKSLRSLRICGCNVERLFTEPIQLLLEGFRLEKFDIVDSAGTFRAAWYPLLRELITSKKERTRRQVQQVNTTRQTKVCILSTTHHVLMH